MAVTVLASLVNPEVYAGMVDKKLTDLMRFSPLADISYELEGRPGNTIYVPSFSYIGDASVVAEGVGITPAQLTASAVSVTIHKIAKAVEITDEAVLSGLGDPLGESIDQVALAIAAKADNEMLDVLASITGAMLWQTSSTTAPVKAADINVALEKFGEDIDGDKVVLVSPAVYTELRTASGWLPASEIAADRLVRGAVGEAYGCQVIVSNKLTASGAAYIVKPGALRVYMKRDTNVESDRDILKKETIISADKHMVAYLYDPSKAIKLAKKA